MDVQHAPANVTFSDTYFSIECPWNITKFLVSPPQMESARKAWENSPSLEKNSPVTSSSSPITSCASSYSTFSSASMPQIPVASVTPSTSLSGNVTPSYICLNPPTVFFVWHCKYTTIFTMFLSAPCRFWYVHNIITQHQDHHSLWPPKHL